MQADKILKPEIMVFAGPNGSGKSTITRMAKTVGVYINADDIKRTNLCSDMDAALKAEELREEFLKEKADFTFETVLSTERNLNLLCRAKEEGYFIRGIYVLTSDPRVNVIRVKVRESLGGHGVPEEKIRSRYAKAIDLIPRFVEVCDILHIYDNTNIPFRIFKKRKDKYFHWGNKYWDYDGITQLTGISDYFLREYLEAHRKEVVDIMTQLYDREREMKLYVAEERKEEKMNTKVDDIKNLMKNLKLSAKEAMNALGISPQDQKTYLPMLKKG